MDDKKPAVWEEKWDASLGSQASEYLSAIFCKGELVATVSGDTMHQEHARARLAACAPEAVAMLRMILHQWSHECPFCGRFPMEINVPGPGMDAAQEEAHAKDCSLVALLRKAGVLE